MAGHRFLSRGLVEISDFGFLEEGNRFYVFAGSFPSSERLHLRHLVPLLFAQHLQAMHGAPVVIHIPDEGPRFLAHVKAILGCGLDKSQTFFLAKGSLPNRMYTEVVKISRLLSLEEIGAGFKDMKSLRDVALEGVLCRTPLFGPEFQRCLRLGQDPFRGVLPKISGWREPAVVQFKPLPTLQGELGRTSSHDDNWIVFLSDSHDIVKSKVNKHALSGGGSTIKEHMEKGANLEVDVPYKYLAFFLESDREFASIEEEYGQGRMFTGAVKGRLIQLLNEILASIQTAQLREDEVRMLTLLPCYASCDTPALSLDQATGTFEPVPEVQFPPECCRSGRKSNKSIQATQVVTPYNVSAAVDYDKLISDFGCMTISKELIDRLEKLTGKPAHPFLKRGIFFAHRDLQVILDAYEKGHKFYLYTGRGPSSESLHLGHLLQFTFTKYLQDAFDVPLVIQLSTDEKYLWKDISVEEVGRLARENARDILACGFQLERTFVFSNLDYVAGHFDARVSDIASQLSQNEMCAVFGLDPKEDSFGKFLYPAVQIAPAFSTSFPELFGKEVKMKCLIPCAIDQDPYFRVSRDVASRLKLPKPALIESRFLPSIQGSDDSGKMSASAPGTAIFVSDTLDMIKRKAAKCSVPETLLTYLSFFMRSDSSLENINEAFSSGKLAMPELRDELVRALWDSIGAHQDTKKEITDEVLERFMNSRKLL